jgi:hypothetical protein
MVPLVLDCRDCARQCARTRERGRSRCTALPTRMSPPPNPHSSGRSTAKAEWTANLERERPLAIAITVASLPHRQSGNTGLTLAGISARVAQRKSADCGSCQRRTDHATPYILNVVTTTSRTAECALTVCRRAWAAIVLARRCGRRGGREENISQLGHRLLDPGRGR